MKTNTCLQFAVLSNFIDTTISATQKKVLINCFQCNFCDDN